VAIKEIIKKYYDFYEIPRVFRTLHLEDVYVGYGLNLTKTGIDRDIAEELISREITKIWRHLRAKYKWWEDLDHDVQTKLIFIVYDSHGYDLNEEIVEAIEKGNYELIDIIFNQILEGRENG